MVFLFACFEISISQDLQITEFMASNEGVITDNLGKSSDWIEIYNASNNIINLENYFLTDNKTDKNKFRMPALQLPPSAYYVIWASGDDHDLVKLPPNLGLKFISAGSNDGNFSVISINGENKSLNQRGINLVILSARGDYLESLSFDTYASFAESDSLALYLQCLLTGQIVVFSVRDEASNGLTDDAKEIIASLGSRTIYELSYRDSWGMIAIKGKGVVSECFKKRGSGEASSEISNIHANFKLNKEGEYIGIYDAYKNVIDSLSYSAQITDRSYGRIPQTNNQWAFFSEPTPGSENSTQTNLGQVDPPLFSPSESIFSEPVNIMINSSDSDCKIYYTVDASIPDSTSFPYENGPILIKQSTVIRACCTKERYFDSDIATQTYLIQNQKALNIVSLVTSPDNLWDPKYGIYTVGNDSTQPNYSGRGERWERPAIYSLIDIDGKELMRSDCGLRIHGGVSRSIPKKSFRLYFPEPVDYYPESLNSTKVSRQDVVVLSGGGNDSVADPRAMGRIWSLIRDQLMMQLYGVLGYPRVNKHPVLLYLNGQYWGIYILGERINKQFLKSHVNLKDADLIKDNTIAETGNLDHWRKTIEFFSTADFSVPENHEKALELINVENFTDYYILNLFGANWDWPTHNTYCYCGVEKDAKWNWLLWDADRAFASSPQINLLHRAVSEEIGNEIFFNLVKWEKYLNYFVNRTCCLLNNQFTPERICSTIDSLAFVIDAEINNETTRWGGSKTQWLGNIESIKEFARQRPEHFRRNMNAELNLGGQVYLRILNDEINQGIVKINGNQIENFPFSGIYFADVPIQLQVQQNEGYVFKSWGNGEFSAEFTANIEESDTLNLYLKFENVASFRKAKGDFEITASFPNPFNTTTNMKIFSVTDTKIEIEIYNIKGQSVTSMSKRLSPGHNTITWDAKDEAGYRMPSGVYFFLISDTKCRIKRKVTLLR